VETIKQVLGRFGEQCVAKQCSCPQCKRRRTLVRLPANFKCADVICDFCGYLAQVKTVRTKNIHDVPKTVLGAAWVPQEQRMTAGIYFPLFLVLINDSRSYSIFYLTADLQQPTIFKPRSPLSASARRAGWRGFIYDLGDIKNHFVKLVQPIPTPRDGAIIFGDLIGRTMAPITAMMI
jgi:hypothetical protein